MLNIEPPLSYLGRRMGPADGGFGNLFSTLRVLDFLSFVQVTG